MTETLVEFSMLNMDVGNARIHDEKNIRLIKENYLKFGQYRPFVVQKKGMRILVGNGLYLAMKEAGVTTGMAKAVVLDIDDNEANTLAIADNRSHDLSEFDYQALFEYVEKFDDKLKDLLSLSEDLMPDPTAGQKLRNGEEPHESTEHGTVFVLGDYKVYVTNAEFQKWEENINLKVGLNKTDKEREIKRRLGL